jgi:FixJ family two-component response regulator
MAAMARPVVVVVDDEDASRQALARELESRYGAHYRIMSSASPDEPADSEPVTVLHRLVLLDQLRAAR